MKSVKVLELGLGSRENYLVELLASPDVQEKLGSFGARVLRDEGAEHEDEQGLSDLRKVIDDVLRAQGGAIFSIFHASKIAIF